MYFARLNSKQPIWTKLTRNILEEQPHGISGKKAGMVGQRKETKGTLENLFEVFAALLY